MQRLGYKEVLVTVDDLLGFNPTLMNTIKVGMYRQRQTGGKSWVNVSDAIDSKRLIHYSTIPQATRSKYKLPDVTDLIQMIKNEQSFEKFDQKQRNSDLKDMEILAMLEDAADRQYIKFCPQYLAVFPNEQDKVITYARTHSVVNALLNMRNMYKIKSLHRGYVQITGLKSYILNYNEFCERLVYWAKNGISLIHGHAGSKREDLRKVTDFHIGKMEQYYTHPNQYTYRMIAELLNADCRDAGFEEISIESVKKYFAAPAIKNRLSYYRSKEYYNKNVKPFARRKSALYSGDLYYADGSPIQIFSWNKERTKVIRLNLFAIMDVKSAKIVGFDLSESEDRYNWLAALKMAFSMEMLLPYEMVYDNASATKTEEFKALKEMLLLRGCQLNAAEKGNPQHKSQMERWFGTFQTGYQRMIDGYIGEGIRSKRTNGRIDADFWGKVQKHNGHYTWDTMIMIIAQLIAIYNQKALPKRKAPSMVFTESERPNATAISNEDIAMLFWHSKTLKVNRGEISTTIRHNTYHYKVYDHSQALALNGKEVKMYYDEADLSRVHIFSLTNDYLCELRQDLGIVSAKANQTDADVLDIIKTSKHNESITNIVKKQTQVIADKAALINEEAYYNIRNPFTAAKDEFNNAETKLMLNYVAEQAGIDTDKVRDYVPIENNTPLTRKKEKQPLETRYSKQFQDNNPSLEVVGQIQENR